MFEGVKSGWKAIKHQKHITKIEKAYQHALQNSYFQCKYCKKDLGEINEILALDFFQHLLDEHPDGEAVEGTQQHITNLRNLEANYDKKVFQKEE